MESHPDKYEQIAKLLVPAIAPILARCGFSTSQEREWIRQWGWKEDVMELMALHNGVLINLYVSLPCYADATGDAEYETLAVDGLGHVVGGTQAPFRPAFLESHRAFASRVATTVQQGMAWFDAFDTRIKCMQQLRNRDNKPGTRSYNVMARYLGSLPDLLDAPCCLLHPS